MSAFIVNPLVIQDAVREIVEQYMAPDGQWKLFAPDALTEFASPSQVGEALWHMNRDAVAQRYDDFGEDDLPGHNRGLVFEYDASEASPNPYQRITSLRCLRYQCAEGDVPERPLFKLIGEVMGQAALAIVGASPECNATEWDRDR